MAETKDGLEGVLKYRAGIAGTATVAGGSTLGYVTGVKYNFTTNPRHVYNGSTYAHSKQGRKEGKMSASNLFVDNTEYSNLTATVGTATQVRHYFELQVNGVAGTGEDVYSFEDVVLEDASRDHPEVGEVKQDFSMFFSNYRKLAYADRLIT